MLRAAVSAVVLLCAAVPARAAVDHLLDGTLATPVGDLPQLESDLRQGDWNQRIHAVHGLGAMGPQALPALREALGDADWQVRFTAVHMLGRQGREAASALQQALRTDPCRVVRIAAVDWLGEMGALDALEGAGGDESGVLRMTRWYWLRKQGAIEPGSPQPSGPLNEELNVCLDSPFVLSKEARNMLEVARARGKEPPIVLARSPGPMENAVKDARRFGSNVVVLVQGSTPPAAGAAATDEEPLGEEGDMEPTGASRPGGWKPPEPALPAAPAGPKPASAEKEPVKAVVTDVDRLLELDSVMKDTGPKGEPETLARPQAVPVRKAEETAPEAQVPGREPPQPPLKLEQPRHGEKEELPRPQSPGPRAERAVEAEAGLMEDHGAGTPEHDPIPALLEALRHGALPLRCRAAEELGKRGPAAKEAVPLLLEALRDKSPRLRASAALGLGGMGPAADSAVKALSRALRDKSADVRYRAAHALARIGTPAAKKSFRSYLRREARRSILESGSKSR